MMFPPSILRVRVLDDDSRVNLWIPLIVVWPLIVVLYLLFLPCIIVASILTWPWRQGKAHSDGRPGPVPPVLLPART